MISVIIPLYNKEAIIARTLRSVLSQDYDDYEVIIVDDGSTDKSLEICKHELPRMCHELSINPQIVTFIQQKNGGPSKARNTGVKHAKGDWIVFLDADDELLPGALRHFKRLSDKHKDIEFFGCASVHFDGITELLIADFQEGELKNPYLAHYTSYYCPRTGKAMYSKRLALKCPFDEHIRRYEDVERDFRLFKEAKLYISNIPVLRENSNYSAASSPRRIIDEDYIGHLDFKGKGFWEKMCMFKMFIYEREHYDKEAKKLYPSLYKRYDLLLLMKFIGFLNNQHKKSIVQVNRNLNQLGG